MARAVEGRHGWNGWNGWSRHITDISPPPQTLAALIVAASTLLLVYVVCGEKFNFIALLAGVPLGISPYFLENISYKFDAPYMAMSIFFSIFPFIFSESRKAFVFRSITSLLIMRVTCQDSFGIHILLTLTLCWQDWDRLRRSNKKVCALAAFSFCSAMIFFRLVLWLLSQAPAFQRPLANPFPP
ncbi:MAG: glucosyltransferase domain-containing protein [Treponema sp.]|nr:glucosyltransferase domain-containing protein [Treponema sp.]